MRLTFYEFVRRISNNFALQIATESMKPDLHSIFPLIINSVITSSMHQQLNKRYNSPKNYLQKNKKIPSVIFC